jgi:hypothetical protein
MSTENSTRDPSTSRREFLKQSSGALAGASISGAIVRPGYAAEQNTIQIALIGCGRRGTGAAADALSTKGPTRLVALAEAFHEPLEASLRTLSAKLPQQVNVPRERQFVGLDAYRKAIDAVAPGGVAMLATPPAFRPIHLEYAVAKGCHVFMEKSFAVDSPGIRRVLKAGEEAGKKNLKVAGGLIEPPLRPPGRGRSPAPWRCHRRDHHLLGLPHARARGVHRQVRRHE